MLTFQRVYEVAAARFSRIDWAGLTPSEITKVIYEEMRRLDAKTANPQDDFRNSTMISEISGWHGVL